MNKELLEKAKACKSVEELFALVKDNGITMTEAEATNCFAQLNPESGELSDDELETVAGGCDGDSDESEAIKCKCCPKCGSVVIVPIETKIKTSGGIKTPRPVAPVRFRCTNCNTTF